MKISVSLPAADVEFLDAFAREQGHDSRSAALRSAIRMLRTSRLGDDYAAAWAEWEESGDAAVWDEAAGDGIR